MLLFPALALLAGAGVFSYVVYIVCVPRPIKGFPCLPDTRFFWGDTSPMFEHYDRTKCFHSFFEQLSDKHGPVFQFFWLGECWRPSLVISDPAVMNEVLLQKPDILDRSPSAMDVFRILAPFGALSLPVDKMWKHHRRLMATSMGTKNMRRIFPHLTGHARNLLNLWEIKRARLAENSSNADAQSECFLASGDVNLFTVDVISDLAFNRSFQQLEDTRDAIQAVGQIEGNQFPSKMSPLAVASQIFFQALPATDVFPNLAHFWRRLTRPSLRAAERTVRTFLDKQIQDGRKRVREGGTESSILDAMLEKEWEEEQAGHLLLSVEEIRDELHVLLLAGSDTTSNTIGFMLRYLTDSPEVQKRLHAELAERVPGEPTWDNLTTENTPYLDAVVHETLRHSKTVSATYRQVLVDTVIMDRPVRKGTDLILLTGYGGGPRPASDDKSLNTTWDPEDAHLFKPERWLTSEGRFDAKVGPSLPFGAGIRGCFGKALAILELKIFLALFSQAFFLEPIPERLADREGAKITEAITRSPTEVWVSLSRWKA